MPAGTLAILVTLIAYKLVLLGIGLWAQRRNRDTADFFLGGRRLGPAVAALSASASSSSVWTLLGVSGYAYDYGLSAIWVFPACVGGFALNWWVLAPRLRRLSLERGALTVTEVLAGPRTQPLHRAITVFASVIVLFSLLVYVASQFQGAGKTFAETFELSQQSSILIGSTVVVAYTLLGGFWAVSVTDTLQGLVMAATSIVLPVVALVAVGGLDPLADAVAACEIEGYTSWTENFGGAAAIGLVLGFLGIGLGYPGQPHVVNRFMALRDERAVVTGRRVAMTWAVVVYAGMILLGLCCRALTDLELRDGEKVFVAAANQLLTPVLAGVMIAAVLSAIMSTADSQLLVAASAVSHDLRRDHDAHHDTLRASRLTVLGLSAGAVVAALFSDEKVFSSVLFAWTAMGAAFGPLLLLTIWRRAVPPLATLLAMMTGFLTAVVAYLLPLGHDELWLERVVPFVLATAVALAFSRGGRRT